MKVKNIIILLCILPIVASCNTKCTKDYYCDWKAVSIRYRTKGLRGDLPLGSEVGRTLTFKKDEIIDGKSEEETDREDIANYSRKYVHSELKKFEESSGEINQNDLFVEYGRTEDFKWIKNPIYKLEYVYYSDDGYPITGYETISYEKGTILGWLNGGFYEFEKFAYQEDEATPYGSWFVKNRVSRTSEYDVGIEYYDHYGEIYNIASLEDSENTWIKYIYTTEKYERDNSIVDRLGLSNEQICVWLNTVNKSVIIPINDEYILTELDGTWYRLESVNKYIPQKSDKSLIKVLESGYDWKRVQFVGGKISYDITNPWSISHLYTSGFVFTSPIEKDPLITDIEEYSCSCKELESRFLFPDICKIRNNDEVSLLKYYDNQQGKEIVWIYIDDNTMFNSIDGSWFIIQKMK